MKYYKLLDKLNRNEVVKSESKREYGYFFGEECWKPTTIMAEYHWGDNDVYGEYVEITEAEALDLIDEQREKYNNLLKMAISMAEDIYKEKTDKYGKLKLENLKTIAETLPHTEYKIVTFLYNICEDKSVTLEELENMGFTYRIVNSIRLLVQRDKLTYEQYLNRLRLDYAGRAVKIAELKHSIEYMESNEMTDEDRVKTEKYKKSVAFLESSKIMEPDFKI